METPHKLFDIWETPEAGDWNAQLVNFVGHFKTEELARRYVAAVIDYRTKNGLKLV